MFISPTLKIAALVIFGLVAFSETGSAMNQCQRLFKPGAPVQADRLMSYYKKESAGVSARELMRRNRQWLEELSLKVPTSVSGQASFTPYSVANSVLEIMRVHPVVSPRNASEYDKNERGIGYCFGRAAFAHILFRKIGLQQESIRKIYAVGDLQVPGQENSWDFHVATAVYTPAFGWVVIDTNGPKPEPIRHWMSRYQAISPNSRVRFYDTDASKMSLDLGPYSRVEMGLDLARENDWYHGYWQDMMKSLRETSLETMGLSKLPRENPRPQAEVKPVLKPLQEPSAPAVPDGSSLFYIKKMFGF